MRLLRMNISGLQLFPEGFDLHFVAQQNVTDDNNEGLNHLFANIYTHDCLSLVGINASGKTTSLKLISSVLSLFLQSERLNTERSYEIFNGDAICITTYFSTENKYILKLESHIAKNEKNEFYFSEELLYRKKATSVKSKSKLFEFDDENHLSKKRSLEDHEYLADDLSIFIAEVKKDAYIPEIFDFTRFTNFNFINVSGEIPVEVIRFLDASIEYMNIEKINNKQIIHLKFKNQKHEIEVYEVMALEKYLSSGTIKGLNLFAGIYNALQTSGYLIIDELENHFNKAIIRTIIGLFRNKKVNKSGATLIFSTHYPELLDDFDRNDSIYVCRKEEGITLINLMYLLKRNDIKKSEAYQSNFIGGTAPDYNSYISLKDTFMGLDSKEFTK